MRGHPADPSLHPSDHEWVPSLVGGSWQALTVDLVRELAVREAMFAHLNVLVTQSPEGNLTWKQTESFSFAGETIALRQTRGRGIHKPRQLGAALSITTAFTRFGSEPPYQDSIGPDGYARYHYEGEDAGLASNRSLVSAMNAALPLVYFVGVRPAVYRPVYPIFIIGDDPFRHEFVVGYSRAEVGLDLASLTGPDKVYAARLTRQRLHQPIFRERVLHAYSSRYRGLPPATC